MDYSKRTDNKEAFRRNVFKIFTDACGGDSHKFADVLYTRFTVEDFAYSDDMYYWGVLGYFTDKVIPHKIAVYEAGIRLLGNPAIDRHLSNHQKVEFMENLWLHDISKFCAAESFGYAMYNRATGHGKEGFEVSWHHHKMNNPHHPEYWLNPNRSGELEPIPMPNIYIAEMIADWIGASKTYGTSMEEWLPKNIHKFKFKPLGKIAEMIRDFTGIRVVMDDGYKLITEQEPV